MQQLSPPERAWLETSLVGSAETSSVRGGGHGSASSDAARPEPADQADGAEQHPDVVPARNRRSAPQKLIVIRTAVTKRPDASTAAARALNCGSASINVVTSDFAAVVVACR